MPQHRRPVTFRVRFNDARFQQDVQRARPAAREIALQARAALERDVAALTMANEARVLRAQLKRDLKARKVSIEALLLDPPAFLQTAKAFDMLLALPKIGRVKATKILDSCRVSPSKTFGGLSDRQRAELAARLNQ
jgi:hypothetical protein